MNDWHLTDRIELPKLAKLCLEDEEFSKFIPRLWEADVGSRSLGAGLSTSAGGGKEGPNGEWEHIERGDPDIANSPTQLWLCAHWLFENWANNGALPLVRYNGEPYAPSQDARIRDIEGCVLKGVFEAFCDSRGLPKPKAWFPAGVAEYRKSRASVLRSLGVMFSQAWPGLRGLRSP